MLNRSWKSWARPGGWGCRKSFQHFRGTGTAFHDRPWFYGNKTTQALLTTDRFVLPQMFGKPGEMMWNAVSGVMSEPLHLSQPRHSLLFVTFRRGMMFYSVSKSIDMDYQEARCRKFRASCLDSHRYQPWQGEEGGTHQALVFASQSPVWIQGVWCLLGGEKKGIRILHFQRSKFKKHEDIRPNKAFWRVQFIYCRFTEYCVFTLPFWGQQNFKLLGPKPPIQWSMHLRPYVADFDLCRWTDRRWMDDHGWIDLSWR